MKSEIRIHDGEPALAWVLTDDGEVNIATADHHPNFKQIVERLTRNPQDEGVISLFDVENTVRIAFERITSHITIKDGNVLYDGDVLDNSVSDHILRFVGEGLSEELDAVAAFTERVMTNPNPESRDQLFDWLDAEDFTITSDGLIVGYKACRIDADGVAVSTVSAPASDQVTVNDEPIVGRPVPNRPGDVVEMPRSLVDSDRGRSCSIGLHVGTYGYASTFIRSPILLEVHVDPRDWVSVPSDYNGQKGRVCRYTVVGPVERKYDSAYLSTRVVDAVQSVWDTRMNHTKQNRYPKGHPKAGQFIPKGQ